MSQYKKLTDKLWVSPQIDKSDIDAAAKAGIKLIIKNRPEGEEMIQPKVEDLQAYAAEHGIKWESIPIAGGQVTMDAVEAMAHALEHAEGPVLAYCRSGTRSCTLWALANALKDEMHSDDIIKTAKDAGYDLGHMMQTLEQVRSMKQ